ncbi:hypothetical protein C8Q79DRAFT_996420 [Trametes meyenii]|nr:hypothetical protein C8Q79DRAFT_996420 [Trametes meyenii]
MSARAPFVPQRSASRTSEKDVKPGPAKSPPPALEHFRPNGLLDLPRPPVDSLAPNNNAGASQDAASAFKPLNVANLKKPTETQPPGAPSSIKPRPSLELPGRQTKAPQAFHSAPSSRPVNSRSSSPFFQNPSAFKAPLVPAQLSAHGDEFNSNQAHIVSSTYSSSFDDRSDVSGRLPSGTASDQFRYSNLLDTSFGSHRSRTASQPSLASIHEVSEEEEHGSPRKVTVMGPPAINSYGNCADGYGGDPSFSDTCPDEERFQQVSRRGPKRVIHEGERDYEQGPDAKRYRASNPVRISASVRFGIYMFAQDDFPVPYSGRATPARYLAQPEYDCAVTPARRAPVPNPPLVHSQNAKVVDDEPSAQQALFRLLGQDLDIFAEAHADSYEQARRKWAECSAEEWTKGADELMGRFSKMLDFVKDHMTAKITLYATLHTKIAEHKIVLADRQQALNDARESLVREGGAVVGSMPVFTVAGKEREAEKGE